MSQITPLEQLNPSRFETPAIIKKLIGLQEAKDSSEIENIVTTHDELFKEDVLPSTFTNPAAKEVLRYRQALRVGFEQVRASSLLTARHIIEIQSELERNNTEFRKLPGTALKDGRGQTIASIHAIKTALFDYQQRIRAGYKFYSQDLINNLFIHPYTKFEFVQRDLQVSRLTATKYMGSLVEGGFLQKQKVGRGNYYVNMALSTMLQS